jgi:hypothetical protein
MKNLLFIVIAFLSVACKDFTDESHYVCDPRIEPFVDTFFKEAKARNVSVYKFDVLITLSKDLPFYIFGLTEYDKMRIKFNTQYYNEHIGGAFNTHEDTLKMEMVVLHELGHYYLHRGHTSFNTYSIMTPEGTYEYDYITDPEKRKILLDELFKIQTDY